MELSREDFTHLPLVGKIFPLATLLGRSQLITGSLILFIGAAVGNFGNYLYHLLMGRMLGPENYGILSSLISLTYFLGVPVGALNLLIVKNVSALKPNKKAAGNFYFWIMKKVFVFVLLAFFLILLISPVISSSLKIGSPFPVIIILLSGTIGVFLSINLGVFRGLLKFTHLAAINVGATALKLFLAIWLVYLGFGVIGAVSPFLISTVVILLITFWLIFRFLDKNGNSRDFKDTLGVTGYLLPIFFFNLAHTSLYSSDIILARRFLPSEQAGFYAALSTLGKIIFFAVSPVVAVMFPLVSERHSNGGNYKKVFKLSFLLVLLAVFSIGAFYLFFPKIVVQLLFGKGYLLITPYLKIFAAIFLFFTLSFLLLNYFLSIGKTKAVLIYLLAAIVQILLIFFFHQNLFQLSVVSLVVMVFLFISLVLYYFLNEKE
jgi:O-antigen/teichoic acid export membrane protein